MSLKSNKPLQEYLSEIGFYEELSSLKRDLESLENQSCEILFDTAVSWKIITNYKNKPSLSNGFGIIKNGSSEETDIRAYLRWGEKQLKEIEETGYVTIYQHLDNGDRVPRDKSTKPQEILFDCCQYKRGHGAEYWLYNIDSKALSFEELKKELRDNAFWYLAYKNKMKPR